MSFRLAPQRQPAWELWDLFDGLCLTFENAWRSGEQPRLEEFLQLVPAEARGAVFRELFAIELSYRQRGGEPPDKQQYLERFPDLQATVAEVWTATPPPLAAAAELAPGNFLGRYRLVRELGRGAFGVVFLAIDEKLERPVAIKLAGDGSRASAEQTAGLLREIQAASQLHHPGIVGLYDAQPLAGGGSCAVMEYVAGRSLRAYLAESPSVPELVEIFASVADALAYAHSQGFVHRDLNPRNILLDGENRPRISDFGLCVHERNQRAAAGERAGSLPYLSPEQVRGETHRIDGRTDIWAMGVMLYESLTGRRPFAGSSAEETMDEILHRHVKPPRQVVRHVPAELERVCLTCLAKSPVDRYSTAADLSSALRGSMRRRVSRRRAALALSASSALVVLALVPAWQRLGRPPVPEPPAAATSLEVLTWKHREWLSVAEPAALPLRPGDSIRLVARSPAPQHWYVVWIDGSGELAPVYPWQKGEWTPWTTADAHTELHLPGPDPDQVWTMQVAVSGVELAILLGRPEPLPTSLNLQSLLHNLPLPRETEELATVRFDYERVERFGGGRHPRFGASSRMDDPVLVLQRALREQLQTHFAQMQCLLIPVRR